MKRNRMKSWVFPLLALCPALDGMAGTSYSSKSAPVIEETPEEVSEYSDWCSLLKFVGTLYSNSDNPLIQEFKIMGRLQYQLATLDGTDSFDDDVSYDTDEFRRARIGASLKFLDYFQLSANAQVVIDNEPRGGERGIEFAHLWDGSLKFDAKKAFGWDNFDAFKIAYGRREVNMAEEWNTSSKYIKTVERSSIANKIWPSDGGFSNPTGFWFEGAKGDWSWHTGMFTTTTDDWIADWDDGQLYYGKLAYDFTEQSGMDLSEVFLAAFYQDADLGEERLGGGIDWATSLALRLGHDRWAVRVNGILGDNGEQTVADREGSFWGLVVMPTYWLVQDRWEAVARYQYQGSSEDQGIRINSRYVRRAQSTGDAALINGGRGDEHHSLYGGINYYLCGDNAKIMAGVQYDDITSGGDDVFDGLTGFLAFRVYF